MERPDQKETQELDEFVEEIETEAQKARKKSMGLVREMFDRGRVRHVKRNGKRVEVAGRLPHMRHPRASRNMKGYRRKAAANQRQIDGATRRRQQDRRDAEVMVAAAMELGVVPKATGRALEGMIQEATRQLVENRGSW